MRSSADNHEEKEAMLVLSTSALRFLLQPCDVIFPT